MSQMLLFFPLVTFSSRSLSRRRVFSVLDKDLPENHFVLLLVSSFTFVNEVELSLSIAADIR